VINRIPIRLRSTKLLADACHQNNTPISHRYPAYASNFRQLFSNITSKKGAVPPSEEKGKKGEEAKDAAKSEEAEPEINTKELLKKFDQLTVDADGLKTKNEELNDKYKRALADGENLRVRLSKQIEDAKVFGIQGFCRDLLEVADVLNKATECVPKEEVSESNPHLKNLYEGLIMTETVLKKVFTRHGLQVVNPIDEKFDPNQHEALFQQEVEGKDPGTVVVVSKIGYKLKDRVIRPALVGVSK